MSAEITLSEIRESYAADVDEALTRFHNRTQWESSTEETPVDSILTSEPVALEKFTDEQLQEKLIALGVHLDAEISRADCVRLLHAFDENERGTQRETVTRLFQYFSADGIHPASVLKRVFGMGAHMAISPFSDLNLRERALMLGDSHGAQHWRMNQICVSPLVKRGNINWKAPGQKSLGARATYSERQQGNTNRRGGAKSQRKFHHTNGTPTNER
jgi:hypothetical protein